MDDMNPDTSKEIAPDDRQFDILALMQAEAAEVEADPEAEEPGEAENDADGGERKRDYLIDLWPFAQPTKFYEELVQTLCKADAANVGILASGSAHPSAWVARHRMLMVVCMD